MAIKERDILALLKGSALDVVREDDGSLSLVFKDASLSPWKFTVPITKVRASDGATLMCGGSMSLLHGLPAFLTDHLISMETSTNTDVFTLSLVFKGASCPESRMMRKAFEHYVTQHHADITLVRTNNMISTSGVPKALNSMLKQLCTARARNFLHWKASTLLNAPHGGGGVSTSETSGPLADGALPALHLRRV